MAWINFRMGMDCSQTVPVPLRVARNIPSPPKTMDLRFPEVSILKSIPGVYATIHPVSIFKGFIIQSSLNNCTTCMHECFTIAFQFLKNKSFTSYKTASYFAIECNGDFCPFCSTKKSILLYDQIDPPRCPRSMGMIFPG